MYIFWVNFEKKTNAVIAIICWSFVHAQSQLHRIIFSKKMCLCVKNVLNMNGKNGVWMHGSGIGCGKHPFFHHTSICLFEEKLFAISKLNYSKILSLFALMCLFVSITSTWSCDRAFVCALFFFRFHPFSLSPSLSRYVNICISRFSSLFHLLTSFS